MRQSVLFTCVFVFGGLIGLCAAYLEATDDLSISAEENFGAQNQSIGASLSGSRTSNEFHRRFDIVQKVEAADTQSEVVDAIYAAENSPKSPIRAIEIRAWYSKLFEIDGLAALQQLIDSNLSYRERSLVFQDWTRLDADRARSLIGDIPRPQDAVLLSLALLDKSGHTLSNIGELASEIASINTRALLFASLSHRAEGNISAAHDVIATAQLFGSSESYSDLLVQLGRGIANTDPHLAVSYAEQVSGRNQRLRYLDEVHKTWALNDPSEFLDYVREQDGEDPSARAKYFAAILIAAEAEPGLVLDTIQELRGGVAEVAIAAALEGMAVSDPVGAIEVWETFDLDERINVEVVSSLATGITRGDFEFALNWLNTLPSGSIRSSAKFAILTELSSIDTARALQVELSFPADTFLGRPGAPSWLQIPYLSEFDQPAAIADELARPGSTERELVLLRAVLNRWAQLNLTDVMAWVRSRQEVAPDVISSIARAAGNHDSREALGTATQLPNSLRQAWISGVVDSAASGDPEGLLSALNQYSTETYYDTVVTDALLAIASHHGAQAAAELGGRFPPERAARLIGGRWAADDPDAAAEWALTLTDPVSRNSAVSIIVTRWAGIDENAAYAWAISLLDEQLRQQTITLLCQASPSETACE